MAQSDADFVTKDSRNAFQKYSYTSAESMFNVWTKLASKHGLVLTPLHCGRVEAIHDKLELNMMWVLRHVGSSEQIEIEGQWPIVEGKGRPFDKAVASARTAGLNYMIRDLLVVPRVDPTDDMDHPKWNDIQEPAESKKSPPPPPPPVERGPTLGDRWESKVEHVMKRYELVYNDIVNYCNTLDRPHPREWTIDNLVKMINWSCTPAGQKRLGLLPEGK